jgi:hypothetical protein
VKRKEQTLMEVIRVRELAFVSYLEQSTLGETVKGKVIPQLAGRACANWGLGFICLEADLMQLQAACLSAVVDAEAWIAEIPEQHAAGGFPVPFMR